MPKALQLTDEALAGLPPEPPERHRGRPLRQLYLKPKQRLMKHYAFTNSLAPQGGQVHPRIKAWLARHPRYHIHYTPTYASCLHQVECWFALITQHAIRRGSFRSVRELVAQDRSICHAPQSSPPSVRLDCHR